MSEQSHDERPRGQTDGTIPSDDDVRALDGLTLSAPDNTFLRFRRRAAVVQGTRMLLESQVIGFWIVLNAVLRILLSTSPGPVKSAVANAAKGE